MKVSHRWLQTFFDKPFEADGVAATLTDLGLEVEEVIGIQPGFTDVLVGEVLDRQPHPDADRLSLCTVNVGEPKALSIVCGAKNVRAGLKVAVAMIGAELPNGIQIKKSKIRGIESEGMICASQELGLKTESEGIMELPTDAPIGQSFADYAECHDTVWDLSITPNRSDCLSHLGIARELSIDYATGFKGDQPEAFTPSTEASHGIRIDEPKSCPVYAGMLIEGIDPNAKTPLWLSERLHRCGIRSIHPVVDVTNYMMLTYGQPMHAFDANSLRGDIQVRSARAEESVTLLNHATLCLSVEDLLIADDEKVLAVAGVMGSLDTQVSQTTTRVFLESAYFDPNQIRKTAARYMLHSDSSHRFERGVDPSIQEAILLKAARLIQSICGGACGPARVLKSQNKLVSTPIRLEVARVAKHLGVAFTSEQISEYLGKIGIQLQHAGESFEAHPPSYRVDLLLEVDLIEEIARLHGYNQFPTQSLDLQAAAFYSAPVEFKTDTVVARLSQLGYQETIHYAFISESWFRMVHGPDIEPLALANPLSDEYAFMRQSLWPGLLKSLVFNAHRQHERVRLFEIGTCFMSDAEVEKIAGLIAGDRWPKQWAERSEKVDFYDIKAHVMQLTQWMDLGELSCRPQEHPALHPHQSMGLYKGGECIGMAGRLSPILQKKLKLSLPVMLFEINYSPTSHQRTLMQLPSEHPDIQRDLALVVPGGCSHDVIVSCIQNAAGALLKGCTLFDIYSESSADEKTGKKMAFSLIFNGLEKTLTDEMVNKLIEKILNQLNEDLGISLRK